MDDYILKKVLVINANPKTDSFCKSLADNYALTAALKNEVKQVEISEMHFEISLDTVSYTHLTLPTINWV